MEAMQLRKKTRFFDIIRNGKLSPHIAKNIRQLLADLEGKEVIISIKLGSKRSDKQNKYYWSGVIPYVREVFENGGSVISEDEAHDYVKRDILKMERGITLPDGSVRRVVGSTTKVSKEDWERNMTIIRVWAAQWGVNISEPTKQGIERELFERTIG